MIINNKDHYKTLKERLSVIDEYRKNTFIQDVFLEDFTKSFCWSSNAIEGNTLSLEETISFLEFDEVHSGHTFREYSEAKQLYKAIKQYLSLKPQEISLEWIRNINAVIQDDIGEYRTEPVYIGSLIEAIYYPPAFEKIPDLMKEYMVGINDSVDDLVDIIKAAASYHIEFERIHPFKDGNGRTGRIILNQYLINNGLLPISISPKSKYYQGFKEYDKNEGTSIMEHIILKGEIEALDKIDIVLSKIDDKEIDIEL